MAKPVLLKIDDDREVSRAIERCFIDKVKNDHVDFHFDGKLNNLFDDITVEEAKWMGHWLSQLSYSQVKDAFRAANYNSLDVLAGAFQERIKELVELPDLRVNIKSGQEK